MLPVPWAARWATPTVFPAGVVGATVGPMIVDALVPFGASALVLLVALLVLTAARRDARRGRRRARRDGRGGRHRAFALGAVSAP
jgi:hypothetical protein